MVSVYPIRRLEGNWEHLIIKRATVAYNWQCVTGGVDENELILDAAHRELFEEAGYKVKKMIQYFPNEDFMIDDEGKGDNSEELLQKFLLRIDNFVYVAIVDGPDDPLLDPNEHTDWNWCDYQTAYDMIKWSIEKKQHRIIRVFIDNNNFS